MHPVAHLGDVVTRIEAQAHVKGEECMFRCTRSD